MSQTILILLHVMMISLAFKIDGLVLKMIPIDSPHLNILPQHFTAQERRQFLTNITVSRVGSYSKKSSKIVPNSITSQAIRASTSYYLTIMNFGTGDGYLSTYLLLDTASSDTWVQCEGCDPCIELSNKNFPYKDSPTYWKMDLDDPMCDPYVKYDGTCGFDTTYGDEAVVAGFVGRDTFHFEIANKDRILHYPNLAFGCGLHSKHFNFGANNGPHNVIAGIHGLAPGPRSFLSQLPFLIKGRFSYCLVPWTSVNVANSRMYFGDDAQIRGDGDRKVQTISMHNRYKYHLYLNGISVDGNRLPIDPSIFELDWERYEKGFFIDSGTPYTTLAKSAYNPLKEAVAKYFVDNYGWHPSDTATKEKSDLCYLNDIRDIQSFPSVILHFQLNGQEEEIDWIMAKDNLFQMLNNDGGFCLAMYDIDDPGPNFFGAFQQANFNILYDVDNGLLSFVPHKCEEATI